MDFLQKFEKKKHYLIKKGLFSIKMREGLNTCCCFILYRKNYRLNIKKWRKCVRSLATGVK